VRRWRPAALTASAGTAKFRGRRTASGTTTVTARLDGRCYDTWPVSATFVEAHGGGWRRARFGL
jgi:hypothetical protein